MQGGERPVETAERGEGGDRGRRERREREVVAGWVLVVGGVLWCVEVCCGGVLCG